MELMIFHPKIEELVAAYHNNKCPSPIEAGFPNIKAKAATFTATIGLLIYSPYGISISITNKFKKKFKFTIFWINIS